MTVVEIIIAELHCLSNGGHRVDCSVSYVRDGLTKNKENAYVPAPEQKMIQDRTEPTLFRAGTVPETVPVRSLLSNHLSLIFVMTSYCSLSQYNSTQLNKFQQMQVLDTSTSVSM